MWGNLMPVGIGVHPAYARNERIDPPYPPMDVGYIHYGKPLVYMIVIILVHFTNKMFAQLNILEH